MASAYPKILAQIVVPTGGWAFVFGHGGSKTATVPAGTYGSILELCSALQTALTAADSSETWTVTCSSVGIVAIAFGDGWTWTAASTDAALKTALGLAGDEEVAAGTDTLTASTQHAHGWYPGVWSYGSSSGMGPKGDSLWSTEETSVRAFAGPGDASYADTDQKIFRRALTIGPLHIDELRKHRGKGPIDLQDRWQSLVLRWYPDRTVGTVAAPGTPMYPGSTTYDAEDDHDYWTVSVNAPPRIIQGQSPLWYDIVVELMAVVEPTSPSTSPTTWATLAADGRGEVVYLLEIPGVGVFSTYDYVPTDAWYTSAGYTSGMTHPWLEADLPAIEEQIDFVDATFEVGALSVKIIDPDGAMTALLKDWRARTFAWLATNHTATATTFALTDREGFPTTTTDIFVGQEVARYTGVATNSFTGVSRGLYGTTARTYRVRLDSSGVLDATVVTDGLHTIVGRRCVLHAAMMVGGVPGATTVVFRGRIGSGIKVGSGEWVVPIEHISAVLKQKVGSNMPQTELCHGYYMAGTDGITTTNISDTYSISTFSVYTAGTTVNKYYPSITNAGWYTIDEIIDKWNTGSQFQSATLEPELVFNGEKVVLSCAAGVNYGLRLNVRKFDPLWCLGFEAGEQEFGINTIVSYEAGEPPRLFVAHFDAPGRRVQPAIRVKDGGVLTTNTYAIIPGNTWVKIVAITNDTVTLGDYYHTDPLRRSPALVVEEEEADMLLRQCFVFSPQEHSTVKKAMRRMLGLATNQVEPYDWCAAGAVTNDFDWTELDAAVDGLSIPSAENWLDCIVDSAELWSVIGPWFALYGVCPRITTDGKIGFKRLETPITLNAEAVELDSAMWEVAGAARIQADLGATPLVNCAQIAHSHNYINGGTLWKVPEWGAPIKLSWKDGLNQLGRVRAIKYEVRGLVIGVPFIGAGMDLTTFAALINQRLMSTIFGIFGREASLVDVPVTWKGKQLRVGDTILMTHPTAPDTARGALGVTDVLGIIVGARRSLAGDEADVLTVQVAPAHGGAGIAPCALGTAYTNSELRLTCDDADTPRYAQSGSNDLDAFKRSSGTVNVRLYKRSTTMTQYAAVIASNGVDTNAKTVVFTSNPFAPATIMPTGGVYLCFDLWTNCDTNQRLYAFIATNAATPILGTNDDAKEWTI